MIDEEVSSEVIEDENREEAADYLREEEIDVGSISTAEIELFLSRAEIWSGLLQDKISINEALNLFSLSKPSSETPKETTKRSRKRQS